MCLLKATPSQTYSEHLSTGQCVPGDARRGAEIASRSAPAELRLALFHSLVIPLRVKFTSGLIKTWLGSKAPILCGLA